KMIESPEIVRGYARLHRMWKPGDRVEFTMPMPVRRVKAHPAVKADAGRVALMRGPLVYCVESVDHEVDLDRIYLPPETKLTAEYKADLLGGVVAIEGQVEVYGCGNNKDRSVKLRAIPYYTYANRGPVEMRVWLVDDPQTIAMASHVHDSLEALNEGVVPKSSDDQEVSRFTWWNHKGSKEWVQYCFPKPRKVSAVEVYWWDERRIGRHCRVPQSWKLLYRDGDKWMPVTGASEYGIAMDKMNRVTFKPVTTSELRLEVQLQEGWSGGILEWRVLDGDFCTKR
ncbi:MAG: glycoside hydrolase family 127 protein, partial [Pirellulales bacterium]|nr:glycoside hydrolase family 127 protein [Pirellulales bacterium]